MLGKQIRLLTAVVIGMFVLSCTSSSDISGGSSNDANAEQDAEHDAASRPDQTYDAPADGISEHDATGKQYVENKDSSTTTDAASSDPIEQFRQACVDRVNELRATKGLPPMQRWTSAESCTDTQAEKDESSGKAHGSFGTCNEQGQNTCPGWNLDSATDCLNAMWSEKDYPGCSGCDACSDTYTPSCPNCDFFGIQTGKPCGHYVNMSAKYLSKVACGVNSKGNWININFQ